MEDGELLKLLKNDPDAGMERLIDQYAGLVYSVVGSRLDPAFCLSSDREDCVADAFSRFYSELSRYDPEKSGIGSWLCVIARNLAINLSKKRRAEAGVPDGETSLSRIPDDEVFESEADEAELRREVIKAVENLGEPDSSIIFRKYYYGESSKQIAEELGISVANVDTRTHRALKKLKTLLGGSEG